MKDVGFPNVRHCERREETDALNARYRTAIESAQTRSCEVQVRSFEEMVTRDSRAVINRSIQETVRLATDQSALYATYYRLTEAEVRLPKETSWDLWRRPAEEAVLPGYKERIVFGALSLDSVGLPHYGPCAWVCKTEQIAHRATVFEGNCVVFMWQYGFKTAAAMPNGYRAIWQTRAKLAVAKLAPRIKPTTKQNAFPSLLLTARPRGEMDEFIEVHIYGSLSIYALEQVTLQTAARPSKAELQALKAKLSSQGVALKTV